MRLVCISDTHGDHQHVSLPAGDVLVHSGDICGHGTEQELLSFLDWFSSQAHPHKLFIAGNHDTYLESNPSKIRSLAAAAGVTYLCDDGCTIDDVTFWGSPITPRFFNYSFMRDPGVDIERHWLQIPSETNVLVTHGPPYGVLDQVAREGSTYEHAGCPSLLTTVEALKPRFHIFGHIHECYGQQHRGNVSYVNASTMNQGYVISNPPITLTI